MCQGQHDGQSQLEHSVSIALTETGQREQRDGRDKVDLGDNTGVYYTLIIPHIQHICVHSDQEKYKILTLSFC